VTPGSPEKVYVLANTCVDQRANARQIKETGKGYFVVPFHEDMRGYVPAASGTIEACRALVDGAKFMDMRIDIQRLEQFPEIVNYSSSPLPRMAILQAGVLHSARRVFPSSRMEARTVVRDAPAAKTVIVPYPTDVQERFSTAHEHDFAHAYGIGGDYILQVGRLEARKNQVFTALACRDLPFPLVFIATRSTQYRYVQLLCDVIRKYRKYPTFIIAQDMESSDTGPLHVRKMKGGEKLPWSMLGSAYAGALVNVHPAFCELPGLTYIESIAMGRKTVISRNASIAEYIIDLPNASGLYVVDPRKLKQIREGVIQAIHDGSKLNARLIHQTPQMYCEQIVAGIRESLNPKA